MSGISDNEKEKLKLFFQSVDNGTQICITVAKLIFPRFKIENFEGT